MKNQAIEATTKYLLWLGSAAACAVPLFAWSAVELTEFQPMTPILAAEVNANFTALGDAVVELESFAFQDAAPTAEQICDVADAPCDFADHFAVRMSTTAGRVVRYELTGAGLDLGGVRLHDHSDNPPGLAFANLTLQRRTDPATDWEPIATQELRFDGGGAGGLMDFLVTVPCSAFSFVDTPPAGDHTYRIAVTFEDVGNPAETLELRNCRAFASMAGRISP